MSSSRNLRDPFFVAEPFQSGGCQNNPVETRRRPALRRRVSTLPRRVMQIQSGESMPQLNLPPETARPDRRAGGQFLKFRSIRDECIAWIFSFRNCGEVDAIGKLEWNIFETVDGKIDAAVEQRFIDFLREQSLAADLRQRNVQDLVARRLDRNELDG